MTNDLTLIETDVLNSLLEKALIFDILSEDNEPLYDFNWAKANKEMEIRKANFLSKYISIPLDLDETIVDKLETLKYE